MIRKGSARHKELCDVLDRRYNLLTTQLRTLVLEARSEDPERPSNDTDDLSDGLVEDMNMLLIQAKGYELVLVEAARRRLRDGRGSYGDCADCGAEIPRKRLDAVPFASRCKDCQEKLENEGGKR